MKREASEVPHEAARAESFAFRRRSASNAGHLRRRGFFPTLLDQPEQENPPVEPHIMLSKVWNALAQATEAQAAETASASSER